MYVFGIRHEISMKALSMQNIPWMTYAELSTTATFTSMQLNLKDDFLRKFVYLCTTIFMFCLLEIAVKQTCEHL